MQSSVRLLCVNPEQIRAIWPLARPLIKRAIERTGLSDFAYLELDVVSGDQLLWLTYMVVSTIVLSTWRWNLAVI